MGTPEVMEVMEVKEVLEKPEMAVMAGTVVGMVAMAWIFKCTSINSRTVIFLR
jgi:acid phosphatase family membrane protein YuiD